jgi:hypothetical protein
MRISVERSALLCSIIALAFVLLVACAPAPATPELPELDYLIEHLVPELTAPQGAQVLGGGGGGGNNGMGIETFFLSDLSIAEVHQHYYKQLEEAGWHPLSEQDTENEMITFWELSDKDGATWSGRLEVVFSPPDFPDTYRVNVMILLPQ